MKRDDKTAKHSLSIRLNRGFFCCLNFLLQFFGIKLIYVCDIGLRSIDGTIQKGNKKVIVNVSQKAQTKKKLQVELLLQLYNFT